MLRKALDRATYYSSHFIKDNMPAVLFRRSIDSILGSHLHDAIIDRVNYYNKLDAGFKVDPGRNIGNIEKSSSMYYYDLREYCRYFADDLSLSYRFGDITDIPATPSIVKSRPAGGENGNSVIMNLDRLRHFAKVRDSHAFAQKLPQAVWRGRNNNAKRLVLAGNYSSHRLCNVGLVDRSDGSFKPWLPVKQQLRYRYIISVEGIDVATNLKWIMSSNSLCFMPRCRYETWFMEGRLKPGVHFVLLKDDFSDLEEKITFYNGNPSLAEAIIRNANAHHAVFADRKSETLISLLVLLKYFYLSGQLQLPECTKAWFSTQPAENA